jgi:AcrR family transcriptional regulator
MDVLTSATEIRILDATLRLLARRGLRKVSMTDICAEAGVSRGTLYRYFTSRDDVLAGAEARIERTLRDTLQAAVKAHPDEDARVQVVLSALAEHAAAHPSLEAILANEPRVALDYLARRFDTLLELLTEALEPALASSPSDVRGGLDERQLAELLLRLFLADRVLPGSRTPSSAAEQLTTFSLLATLGAAPAATALRRAG